MLGAVHNPVRSDLPAPPIFLTPEPLIPLCSHSTFSSPTLHSPPSSLTYEQPTILPFVITPHHPQLLPHTPPLFSLTPPYTTPLLPPPCYPNTPFPPPSLSTISGCPLNAPRPQGEDRLPSPPLPRPSVGGCSLPPPVGHVGCVGRPARLPPPI